MLAGTTPSSSPHGSQRRPGGPIGCPPRRSGNMRREEGRRLLTGGERTSGRDMLSAQSAGGAKAGGPRPWVPTERLRIVRHRGERGRMGGGLLEPEYGGKGLQRRSLIVGTSQPKPEARA